MKPLYVPALCVGLLLSVMAGAYLWALVLTWACTVRGLI